ncbi:hypothetical protein [Streptomyces fractus]|uniref:hypothetical protein n=1 Tax=Streptomyces fractus TaxID=641806 RepID=UPI003CE6796B
MESSTSGWTAGSNTSLSKSSRFYDGAASLGMTATAAGSATASTTGRVAVVPGRTYQAYAYFANVVAASGRSATVRIDWYAASSGGSALSSSSSVATALDNSTGWNTPPPPVVADAPSNALYAGVTITVTGLTAGATVAVDVITLGEPYSILGNLLSYSSTSAEVSVGTWSGWTNCTVDRTTFASREGWYSLQLTSSAAGQVEAGCGSVSITPGTEYLAQVMMRSTSGAPMSLELRWYNASSTFIGSSSSPRTLPSDGTWVACQAVGTAPADATSARVVIRPTATAAGQTWLCDLMSILPTAVRGIPGNLLPYTVSDMEPDISAWTATGAALTQSAENPFGGVYSAKLVMTGGDATLSATVPLSSLKPGVGYELAFPLYQVGTAIRYATRLEWITASGEAVRTRWQTWTSSADEWRTGQMGDIAPAGAVAVRLSVEFTGASAGRVVYADRVRFMEGGLVATGTPTNFGGGAAVTVRGLTTGGPTWLWSLYRVVGGDTPQVVRGWDGDLQSMSVTGDVAVVTDYEAPLGVPVQWRVRTWNPSGNGSYVYTSDPVTLPAETLDVWLKDPGLPARSVHATVQTLPEWQRQARQGVNNIRGRTRPIVISDVRSSRTGSVGLVTQTDDERDALWWVLDSGNVLLLQWPPTFGERDAYVSVGDVTESRITDLAEHTDRTWTLALTEVDRPFGGMVGSPDRTWQTVLDSGSSWSSALSGATTWLDVYSGVNGG